VATDARDELPETPDRDGALPRLTDEQIASLERHGERRPTEAGEVLFREGDRAYDFFVVLDGKVKVVVGEGTEEERLIAVHGPGRFLGELSLLIGGPSFLTAVVYRAGEVLSVPVSHIRELATQDSYFGDLLLRAYLIRRSMLIGLGAGLRIIGSRFDPDTRRLREFAARNRIPHRWLDLEEDQEAEELLRQLAITPDETPVVIWGSQHVLRNPSNAELAQAIGPAAPSADDLLVDFIVVGAGPAGLAASVYGASEGLTTVMLDSVATGGQAGTSPRIENYLGFPSGISGSELADRALLQAEKFGARIIVPAQATALEPDDARYVVRLADGRTLAGRTVLIATGAQYRRLPVERLELFEGRSVYYAATAIEARMCGGDPVAVVGGGNSAGQAALFLAQFAASVTLVVRESELTTDMSRYLADRIERAPRVEVMLETEVRELIGEHGILDAVVVENARTGDRQRVESRALFTFIGASPCTDWLEGAVALDADGFVITGVEAPSLETSLPGVLAAGDVRSGSTRRVASAVGEGAMAVRLLHAHMNGSLAPGRAQT
jgi:thioredoxin reductase (NADPH)